MTDQRPAVTLEPMRPDAYDRWLGRAIRGYADDKVRVGAWPAEEAAERSAREFATLLPDGLATPDHYLREVVTMAGDPVGVLWFGPVRGETPGMAFIWDIEIDEAQRGRGYGRAAMLALEPVARELGFDSIGLHVFGDNEVARNLYRSVGYAETDVNMRKSIAPAS